MEGYTLYFIVRQFHQFPNLLFFVLLSILAATILYSVLILIFVPAIIIRQIIKYIVHYQDPKCGPMISGLSALMAAQDPYKPMILLSPYWVFTSKIERQQVVKVLNEQIIKPNMYPELKQRIVRKFGYYFWYPVKNFNVEHHVKYLFPENPDKPITRNELRRFGVEKMSKIPFDSSLSPWEIILVPNLVDPDNPEVKSAVYIRANHCLMDGYSLVNFTRNLARTPWTIKVGQAYNKRKKGFRELLAGFRTALQVLVLGPYHIIKFLHFSHDKSEFLKRALTPTSKEEETWGARESETRKIEGQRLKDLKNKYNVSVSSVLLTLSVEAVIKYIKQKCNDGFSKLPKRIYLHMSFPLPVHPGTMTNYWALVRMPVEVNKHDDPQKTLKQIHMQYENFRVSVIPIVTFGVSYLIGLLPIQMFPKEGDLLTQTIALASIPGPAEKQDMFGYEWVGCGLSGSPSYGSAFIAACQNYMGKFWIDIGGMGTLFKSQMELCQVEDYVFQTLDELESNGPAMKNNN